MYIGGNCVRPEVTSIQGLFFLLHITISWISRILYYLCNLSESFLTSAELYRCLDDLSLILSSMVFQSLFDSKENAVYQ